MDSLNEYGKGRAAVIHEMIEFCNGKIDEIRSVEAEDSHISAILGGQKKAYHKVIEKLKSKHNRLKINPDLKLKTNP